jgi:limonene-1,2-epoxide hydrolase
VSDDTSTAGDGSGSGTGGSGLDGTGLEGASPEQVVDEFTRRLVAKELDRACELVTPDVVYDNVPMGSNVGPEGILSVLGALVDGVDEVEFVVHRQVAQGRLVLNERSDRFRIGERWIDLPVAGVFEVAEDGRICLWRDYFDLPTLTDQLAALGDS